MPITAAGTTELADAIPEIWLNSVIAAFQEQAVLAKLIEVDSGLGATDYAAPGQTYNKQRLGADDVTVQDKDEYEEYESEAQTTEAVPIVLNQHPYIQWKNTEFSQLMSLDLGQEFIKHNFPKMITRIEGDIAAQYTNAAATVGSGGFPITRSTILAARKELREANVPNDRPWALVIGPDDEESLLDTDDFVHVDKTGSDGAMRNGRLGRLFGFETYVTNRIASASGTNYNLALHPSAIVLACRPMAPPSRELSGDSVRSRTMFDPSTGMSFRWMAYYDPDEGTYISRIECLYGIKCFRPESLVQVRS